MARGAKKDTPNEGKPGRPSKFSEEVALTICTGLAKGIPLSIICLPDHMPCTDTVYDWMKKDGAFSRCIARAREAGYDQIALDALAIADNTGEEGRDTITLPSGLQIPDKEWIMRSKLRVDTRLNLLAKWDRKRYGDKVSNEHSGPDGGPIPTTGLVPPDLEAKIMNAIQSANKVEPPAVFRGEEAS